MTLNDHIKCFIEDEINTGFGIELARIIDVLPVPDHFGVSVYKVKYEYIHRTLTSLWSDEKNEPECMTETIIIHSRRLHEYIERKRNETLEGVLGK